MKLPQIRYKSLLILIVLLLINVFCSSVFSYEEIDQNRLKSLTIINQTDGEPIEGVEFELYKVANITDEDPFQMIDVFEDSCVSLSIGATQESWYERAATLEAYLAAQKESDNPIEPIDCVTTNEKGIATFYNLDDGLYLLVGKILKDGNMIHIPVESLVPLPYLEDDEWNYNPTIYTKNETRFISNRKIDLSVVKIWDDAGYESQRPSKVTVTLYQDHKEYSTVELTAENNWRYTWKQLTANSDWDLVEREVPPNYTVTSVLDGRVFVVTNTCNKDISPDPTPAPEHTEAPDSTASSSSISEPDESEVPGFNESPVSVVIESPTPTPNESLTTTSNESTTTSPNEQTAPTSSVSLLTLPQTGQLWWPVSLLSVCGLVLFFTGWIIRWKGSRHDERK